MPEQSQSQKTYQRQVEETRFAICATKALGPPMRVFVTFSASRPRIISPIMSHKAVISLPRLPSQLLRSLPYQKLFICRLTSRCSSRSTYWRSSPPPPTLPRRPLQDATHRCSTDRRSMAVTPFLGHLPHALPSTRLSHRLPASLSPAS